MAKRKLKHFAENLTFPHFFQPSVEEFNSGFFLKGKWQTVFFKNKNPIIIEIGCGKGEYTVGLARANPQNNYIGIDIKGARMWNGASTAYKENLTNTAFLRTKVDLLNKAFDKDEIDEIWITFPDPHPRNSKQRKRLISPKFLNIYSDFIKKNALIHLKTDNIDLFQYSLDVINKYQHKLIFSTFDLYAENYISEATQIQTFYEKMYLEQGKKICYLKFSLNDNNDNKLIVESTLKSL